MTKSSTSDHKVHPQAGSGSSDESGPMDVNDPIIRDRLKNYPPDLIHDLIRHSQSKKQFMATAIAMGLLPAPSHEATETPSPPRSSSIKHRLAIGATQIASHTFLLYPGRVLVTIFNICLIVSSFRQWEKFNVHLLHENTESRLEGVFVETFGPWVGYAMAYAMNLMQRIADRLNFLLQWDWECGGILVFLEWLILVFILLVLFVYIISDSFFLVALKLRSLKNGRGPIMKFLVITMSTLVSEVMYLLLQVTVLAMHHVCLALLLNESDSCSLLDRIVWIAFARFLGVLTAAWSLIFFLELWGGATVDDLLFTVTFFKVIRMTKEEALRLAKGVGDAIYQVFMLSIGNWNERLDTAFGVVERALEFDDDPTDDDNCQERVIELTSKLRTVIWLFIPMLVFMAKIGEAVNQPPIFVRSRRIFMFTPLNFRRPLYALNVLALGATFGIVFYPTTFMAMLLFSLVGAYVLLDMILRAWMRISPAQFEKVCYSEKEKDQRVQAAQTAQEVAQRLEEEKHAEANQSADSLEADEESDPPSKYRTANHHEDKQGGKKVQKLVDRNEDFINHAVYHHDGTWQRPHVIDSNTVIYESSTGAADWASLPSSASLSQPAIKDDHYWKARRPHQAIRKAEAGLKLKGHQ
jgi:hypothetical protein